MLCSAHTHTTHSHSLQVFVQHIWNRQQADRFKKYNHIIICGVHRENEKERHRHPFDGFFILTLTRIFNVACTYACICARSLALSHLCIYDNIVFMCTHRLTFVYIHLWLDCGPFRNSSMDFLSLLVVSVYVRVSPLLAAASLASGNMFSLLLLLWFILDRFSLSWNACAYAYAYDFFLHQITALLLLCI